MTVALRPLLDPQVRSVAIVRLRTGLGDLLASVPALRAVRATRPDLHVTMIGFPEVAEAVRRQGAYVDDYLTFPGHADIPERPAPSAAAWADFLAEARGRRFDLAVQMYGALPAANAVTAELGAGVAGGFVTPGTWPARLDTHLPYPFRAHEIDRHLRLVTFLGATPGSRDLEFPLGPADATELEAALVDRGAGDVLGRPFAVVHPGATAHSRRWPVERFAAVADGLTERGLAVVFTGVNSERKRVAEVAAAMRAAAVDVSGATGLGGVAALVDRAAVVVSGDTGIVQVAVARRTPTVTAYLAGDARRWRGADRVRHRVAAVDVGCNPCGLLTCPIDFRCATRLSPQRVLAEVDAVLAHG
ncbi:MAG: glycosyltransferase family 9 protein [bacterium]